MNRRRRFERKEGKRFEVALPSFAHAHSLHQTVTKRRKWMVLPREMGAHGATGQGGKNEPDRDRRRRRGPQSTECRDDFGFHFER